MNNYQYFRQLLNRFRNVEFHDILAAFQFVLAIIPALFLKLWKVIIKQDFWLICEAENEARDNGYIFFEFMQKEHPETHTFYAINKKAKDYEKLIYYKDKIVSYGSYKHWIYYLAANVNISSQKGGKPNAAVCFALEISGILKNKRVFLQHGIILNNTAFLHYNMTKIRLFIAGAKPESKYLCDTFGYPDGWIQYCGLCRFDKLHKAVADKNRILLMPSWRNWLRLESVGDKEQRDERKNVEMSEYVQKYQELISNKKLLTYLKSENISLYFYPHRNAQPYLNLFKAEEPIVLCHENRYDIQDLLMKSSLMITDYSSVSIDFAYMKKPVIYFQFDNEKFRKYQYEKSYFDYETSRFGKVTRTVEDTVEAIIDSIENAYILSPDAEQAHKSFFELYDNNNCERNYKAICQMLNSISP